MDTCTSVHKHNNSNGIRGVHLGAASKNISHQEFISCNVKIQDFVPLEKINTYFLNYR